MKDITKLIKDKNIYGWMSDEELEFLYSRALEMNSITELGSYKGKSTVALLEGCKGVVTAIDNWKGSGALKMEGNEYKEFLENTKEYKNLKIIIGDTKESAKLITMADMTFIDANHFYENVKEDINAYLPKTKKLMCGHDYDDPEVKRAVDELLTISGLVGSIWFYKLEK